MTGSSTFMGGGESEYRRERVDEYTAPGSGGAAISYDQPRLLMQSYGGRGGYSEPGDPCDGGYMPPPPSRP